MTAESEDIIEFTEEQYAAGLRALVANARTSFLSYFHLFNPQGHSPIKLGELHRLLIQLVQDVYDGTKHGNNAVSVPPQHGKSTVLSVEAPSWILGVWENVSIAITGFSYSLVTKFSKSIRARMETTVYQLIFPGTMPVQGSNKMDEWESTKGGSVIAKSSGSKLTGRRVDWLIMDDVHAGRAEAESPTIRKKIVEWYFADCISRLHPDAKQFLIGTRWHPKDLIGTLTHKDYEDQLDAEGQLEVRKFNKTNIQAICDDPLNDPLEREEGEACFPEERNLAFLRSIRAAIPNYEWESQYQGNPQSVSDGQVDLGNIVYLKKNLIPWEDIDEIVRGWDMAISEDKLADFTAGALVGENHKTGAIYILDMWKNRMSWNRIKPRISALSRKDLNGYGPRGRKKCVLRMGMEGVSGFKIAVEEFKKELLGEVQVVLKNPPPKSQGGGSKLLRAQPWLNKIEAGLVHVVRDDWTKDFIDELQNFPDVEHDDQVDAVSVACEMFRKRKKLLIA